MKKEKLFKVFCQNVNQDVEIKILVHLAERWCGYNIINLSKCAEKKTCKVGYCEIISSEEEKVADQLITGYLEQMDIRNRIRESQKHSNQ